MTITIDDDCFLILLSPPPTLKLTHHLLLLLLVYLEILQQLMKKNLISIISMKRKNIYPHYFLLQILWTQPLSMQADLLTITHYPTPATLIPILIVILIVILHMMDM